MAKLVELTEEDMAVFSIPEEMITNFKKMLDPIPFDVPQKLLLDENENLEMTKKALKIVAKESNKNILMKKVRKENALKLVLTPIDKKNKK